MCQTIAEGGKRCSARAKWGSGKLEKRIIGNIATAHRVTPEQAGQLLYLALHDNDENTPATAEFASKGDLGVISIASCYTRAAARVAAEMEIATTIPNDNTRGIVTRLTTTVQAVIRENTVTTVTPSGTEITLNGQLHNLTGPAYTQPDGHEEHWVNGKLHRVNSPAVTTASGTQMWYQNGKLHRVNGPAVIEPDTVTQRAILKSIHLPPALGTNTTRGGAQWYRDGKLHRVDGPAVIKVDGTQEFWVNGKQVSPLSLQLSSR
jgi:hypothetical protein